jgi:hypothetical protein
MVYENSLVKDFVSLPRGRAVQLLEWDIRWDKALIDVVVLAQYPV